VSPNRFIIASLKVEHLSLLRKSLISCKSFIILAVQASEMLVIPNQPFTESP